MKTLEEVMEGVTPLPWTELAGPVLHRNPGRRIANSSYLLRAANAFPKLVKFVEAQKCECPKPGTVYWRKEWDNAGPVRCPRCELLEEVLR